jgi:hypothetical protein
MTPSTPADFRRDGFMALPGVLPHHECEAVAQRLGLNGSDSAGTRCLLSQAWCAALAQRLRGQASIAPHLPRGARAVQCTYFEKSSTRNWLVPVHQDLSIPVAARVDAPGWRGWSEKEGSLFVLAPVQVLEQLVAVRVHLDECRAADGPLRVVPGSHRLGLLADDEASRLRASSTEVACEAGPGDALLLRPLLLHASSKASGRSRRRVLHFLFGPPELPQGLHWQHAV